MRSNDLNKMISILAHFISIIKVLKEYQETHWINVHIFEAIYPLGFSIFEIRYRLLRDEQKHLQVHVINCLAVIL